MAEILTAAGQLEHASEFRFDYWHTKAEHRYFTVRKGRKSNDGKWAICDGSEFGEYWDGKDWVAALRGPDAYRYELDEALPIVKRLAFEENQRVVGNMEARYPGEFRGGPYDMAARRGRGGHG